MEGSIDEAALDALLEQWFVFFCERRVREFADPVKALDVLTRAATEARVAHWQQRLLVPARKRWLERASKSALPLSVWLSEPLKKELLELAGKPAPLPRKQVDEFVASERVRTELRAALSDSFNGFVAKASTLLGGKEEKEDAKRGGFGAALGWGARAVGAAGKGLLGGLGEEFQKQLQSRASEFVDGSMAALQTRLADKLTSEETAKALGARRRKFVETVLATTEAKAAEQIAKSKPEQIDPFLPPLVPHNLARTELREALLEEGKVVLEELSSQTIGELLDELGLRDDAKEHLKTYGLPLAKAFVQTEGFQRWWTERK